MKILVTYLKRYWPLVVLTLVLASINQVFSLLDPYILRYVIDNFATKYEPVHVRPVLSRRRNASARGGRCRVCFPRRQELSGLLPQRHYSARRSRDLFRRHPAFAGTALFGFEDQRSGETLGKLQKVRTDVEKLLNALINILFTSLVGIIFVMFYAFSVHWIIAPVYFLTIPLLGTLSFVLSRKIKKIQKVIVAETTALAGSTTESLRNIELVKSLGLANQEIDRLNGTTDKILQLELKKVKYLRSLSFIQGHVRQCPADRHHVSDDVSDFHAKRSPSVSSLRYLSIRSLSLVHCRNSAMSSTFTGKRKFRYRIFKIS